MSLLVSTHTCWRRCIRSHDCPLVSDSVLPHLAGFFYETVAPLLCIGNTSFITISTLASEMNFYTVRVHALLGMRCMAPCHIALWQLSCLALAEAHLQNGPADQPARVQVHPNFIGLPGLY